MGNASASSGDDLGQVLSSDRYRLDAELGSGATATVYRAFDSHSGEWVAVKVLNDAYRKKPMLQRRFEIEAMALQRLDHRNIIAVLDARLDATPPFLVLELAEGGCLIDWIGINGPLPPRMAVDAVIQICKGVSVAHMAGIIHRDIKPHNILMNHRGVCKLTDFGIAQMREHSQTLTRTGQMMGTLGYVAPEQRNSAHDVDLRADVYSIGATLFTMLTGSTANDLFLASRGNPGLLDPIPAALRPVIQRATSYEPSERYDTPVDLAKALHDIRTVLPATPSETPGLALRHDEQLVVPPRPSAQNTYEGPGSTPPPVGPTHYKGAQLSADTLLPAQPNPWRGLGLIFLPVSALAFALLAVLTMGGPRANPSYAAAEQAWYQSLAEQVSIIDDLANLGADEQALHQAYRAQAQTMDSVERYAASERYLALVESEAEARTRDVTLGGRRVAQSVQIQLGMLKDAHQHLIQTPPLIESSGCEML